MKHFLLFPLFLLTFFSAVNAQTTPGPIEKKMTDNICDCITKLDYDKIKDKQTAEKAFVECFSQQANLYVQLADERKVDMSDQAAMRNLGTEIGKNLLKQNCQGFLKISMAMVEDSKPAIASGITEGRLKRLESKEFNYFVITDHDNKERSFIWLRQFPGSDSFIQDASKYVGKRIRINWQEMEVYIPSAKNYYNIKEVLELEVL